MPKEKISDILDSFVEQLQLIQPVPPLLPYNSEWPSDCYLNTAEDGQQVGWRPARQTSTSDMFLRLGEALEETIHPDIIEYYSRYWSDPLPAKCEHGDLSLIQVWNYDDMERLRSNLIGHALAKRQQKRPLTFFFACPEPDEDYFISLDNYTGEIWLEKPGKPPIRKLAECIADFLKTVTPKSIDS